MGFKNVGDDIVCAIHNFHMIYKNTYLLITITKVDAMHGHAYECLFYDPHFCYSLCNHKCAQQPYGREMPNLGHVKMYVC